MLFKVLRITIIKQIVHGVEEEAGTFLAGEIGDRFNLAEKLFSNFIERWKFNVFRFSCHS